MPDTAVPAAADANDMTDVLMKAAGIKAPVPPAPPPAVPPPAPVIPPPVEPLVIPVAVPPAPAVPPQNEGDKEKNFASLRKKADAAEQRLAEVFDADGNVKQDFLAKFSQPSPDVEALRKENEALADKLSGYDLQADPRWQAKYAADETRARTAITRIAKEFGVEQSDIDKAMMMPLKERARFLNDNLSDAMSIIGPHFAKLDDISLQKEMDLKTARDTAKALEQQHVVRREQEVAKMTDALYSQVCREMQDVSSLFRELPGNEEYNKVVKGIHQTFKQNLTSRDPVSQARSMALAAEAPVLRFALENSEKENARLRAELQARTSAAPSINQSAPSDGKTIVDASKMSPLDLARIAAKNAMGG